MRFFVRLVWGGELDPPLRPLIAVDTVSALVGTMLFPFMGVWAVERLGASQVELSLAFLGGACGAIVAGYAGGHLSDHVGRRPVILATAAGFALAPLVLLGAGHRVAIGLAVVAIVAVLGAANGAAEDAMVADLLPEERRVSGYAAVRVAKNLGVSFGPPLGGLLLLGAAWGRLFAGVAVLGFATWLLAFRLLPRTGNFAPRERPARGSFGVVRRDRAFLVFVGAMTFAWMTYVAYETLLPISLVKSHGIAASTWGFLLAVNPICVTLLQVRLTRWTARFPAALKLAVAMPLMGVPFALLQLEDSVWLVLALVAVFVVGEMLWVPTSQAVAARFAPEDLRGAYMGVIGSGSSVAWAITPFVGLQLRAAFGDASMWDVVGAVSIVAALAGAAATRRRSSEIPHIP